MSDNPSQVTRIESLFGVIFPDDVRAMWSALRTLVLDLVALPSLECAVNMNAYTALQLTAALPLIVMGTVLVIWFLLYERTDSVGDKKGRRAALRSRGYSALLLVSYAIYPSLAARCFVFFPCDTFTYANGPRSFLRSDLSISCDEDAHSGRVAFAVLCTFVYVVGIPFWWALVLWPHRKTLRNPLLRDSAGEVQHLSFLWGAYSAPCWWYELFAAGYRAVATIVIVSASNDPRAAAYVEGLIRRWTFSQPRYQPPKVRGKPFRSISACL